jgi:predicted RNA methylase
MASLENYTGKEGQYVRAMVDNQPITFQTQDVSTDELTAYLLYTETTDLISPPLHHRLHNIFNEEEIDYLGLNIPDFQYFFTTISRSDIEVELSVPGPQETRRVPIPTADTFIYCIRLAMYLSEGEFSKFSERLTGIIQNLLRKWRLEDIGYEGTIADDSFLERVQEVDEELQEEYDFYNPTRCPPESAITLQTFGVFNAFSLHDTDQHIRDEVVTTLPDEFEPLDAHRTGTEIRGLLLDLANLENGDKVLDPAAGVGSLLRAAAREGATPHGVEIDSSIATIATALNELNGFTINLICADFVDLADEIEPLGGQTTFGETPFPMAVDSIITDLPFLSTKTSRAKSSVPERILSRSLDFLADGGTATILAPAGLFYQKQAQELRDKLLHEYQINLLLQIEEGELDIHRNTQVGILQVTNRDPADDHTIKVGTIKTDEISQGPQEVEEVPQADFEQTLDPERVKRRKKAQKDLTEFTIPFIKLEEIGEIRSGSQISRSQLQDEGLPFLRIRNVTQDEEIIDFIPEETANVVAEPSDLLVSIKYSNSVTHVPESRLVPGSDWAIIRCKTREQAQVYAAYLQTPVGKRQLDAARTEGVVPYIALSDLRSVAVPQYNEEDVVEIVEELESISMGRDDYGEVIQDVMLR